MQITLAEFAILLDTLMGSLRIADGATIWRFEPKLREELANTLLNRMNKPEELIDVKTE
jgi:hypothetical protein